MLFFPSQATEEHPSAARLRRCVAETPGQDWTLSTDLLLAIQLALDTVYCCVPNRPEVKRLQAACAHDYCWEPSRHCALEHPIARLIDTG